MRRTLILVVGIVFCYLGSSGVALAESPANPSPPTSAAKFVPGQVILKLVAGSKQADLEAGQLVESLTAYGVTSAKLIARKKYRFSPLEKRFGFDRLFLVEVSPGADINELCSRLAEDPRVEFAHPNFLATALQEPPSPDDTFCASDQWNLHNTGQTGGTPGADIRATDAWCLATGRPEIIVAVVDGGFDGDHIELRSQITPGGYDAIDDDFDPEASGAHGSEVGGVVGAATNNEFGLAGVVWHASLMPVRVWSPEGGTITGVVAGILHAANRGADVINISLGWAESSPSLQNAIAYAHAAGVVQFAGAGNDGVASLLYPAGYAQVLAVGGTTHTDGRYASSNYGPDLDLVAPAVDVPVIEWDSDLDLLRLDTGTSFAAPQVAAAAALVLTIDPTLSSDEVFGVLRSTSDDMVGPIFWDPPGRDNYYGWGRLNVLSALSSLGAESRQLLHVEKIDWRRIDFGRLEIRVWVVDELTGIEQDAAVDGTLTLPNATTTQLSGLSDFNGIATLVYEPGGDLPSGTFTLRVDNVDKEGFTYDPEANRETEDQHDPDLNGIHVKQIDMHTDFASIVVEVQTVDDDNAAEGEITVFGTLTLPGGSTEALVETTRWAAGGVARLLYEPAILTPGLYLFSVDSLFKMGFVYEDSRNEATSESLTVLAPSEDFDGDGIENALDNCLREANPLQEDVDEDGHGDVCDVCPAMVDPSQRDTDGDDAGNRCDCGPYDATRSGPERVRNVRIDDAGTNLAWDAVLGADHHDVSRVLLSELSAINLGECIANDYVGLSLLVEEDPPPGDGFAYAVRADNAVCGPGSWGTNSQGNERLNENSLACSP